MKKINLLLAGVLLLTVSSCKLHMASSTAMPINATITSESTAELKVMDKKVSYVYTPNKQERQRGLKQVKENAVAKLLEVNGNADVLVHPQYVVNLKKYIFRSKILSVEVKGYPAYFVNVKAAND